jgi:hypothetical protein
MFMKYTFDDGTTIDLTRVVSVSPVRDLGQDPETITMSRIGFTVHLNRREFVQITRHYHYADWASVKNELERVRKELIQMWETETE